jgi:hypothetical protein
MTDPQPTTTDTALIGRITALPDPDAVRVLALVLEQTQGPIDQLGLERQEPELRQAVTDPALAEFADPGAAAPEPGELARTALLYLADTRPDLARTINRALGLPPGPDSERIEPLTLVIGGLIVLALQTDLTVTRTNGKLRFRLHKQAMKDSTLGTLLGKLVDAFTPGQP